MKIRYAPSVVALVACLGFAMLVPAAVMAADDGAKAAQDLYPPGFGGAAGRGRNNGIWDTTSTVNCDSAWNGSCDSEAGGTRVCAPPGDEICGFATSVTSSRNGRYEVTPIDKRCLAISVSARGNANASDQRGGTIVVDAHVYSINPANPPDREQRDKFCVQRKGAAD